MPWQKPGSGSVADSKTTNFLRQRANVLQGPKGRALLLLSTHTINNGDTTWYDLLRVLDEEGIPSIFMSEMWDFMQGNLDLPPLAVVLRGDDAPGTWYTNGFPMLKDRKHHKFTMYFSLWHQQINSPGSSITDAQIQEMLASGMCEVQMHAGLHGHDPNMPINGSGGVDYYYANRMWLSDQSRSETDSEFQTRVEADIDTWLDWYNRVVKPITGGTTLHFAPPDGMMGADGAGGTRHLLIDSLKKKGLLTATWRNHNVAIGQGTFVTVDGAISYGQTNANYDLTGYGVIGDAPNVIRNKLRVAKMDYMPDSYFASKFDNPVGSDYNWYVQSANGGDTFTQDGSPYLKDQDNSLKLTFGASTNAGWSYWQKVLPNNMDDLFLQVVFGVPTGFSMPNNATIPIASFGNTGIKIQLVTDASGNIIVNAISVTGTTTISLGSVSVPASGVNWYVAEVHLLQHANSGMFEAWWQHKYVSGQRGKNTIFTCNNTLQIGKLNGGAAITGLAGSMLFARVVVDSRMIGKRNLLV